MPNIRPTPASKRKRYRETLDESQRAAFDRLAELIDAPRRELGWYHEVGTLVRQMFPDKERGKDDVTNLAKALGPCREMLQKAARFALLYPKEEDVKRLVGMGVDWTRLWISFPVKEDREKLLLQALKEKWTITRLRFAVQDKYGSKRRGVGGRPPTDPEPQGPEVALRELGRRSQAWLRFYRNVWKKVRKGKWKGLVAGWPASGKDKLNELLDEAGRALADIEAACKEARQRLAELGQQAGQDKGGTAG